VRKLTIVATCTERKSLPVDPRLRVRSLPAGSVTDRVNDWQARLAEASDKRSLTALYQGEAWTQARQLATLAALKGYTVELLVASAGLGLRPSDWTAPAYGATFVAAHADSVGESRLESRTWWTHLAPSAADALTRAVNDGSLLLVLSSAYALALDNDLRAVAEAGGDALLVGGNRDLQGLPRLPSDRRLRRELGGTLGSLNLRMARAWLTRADTSTLYTADAAAAWTQWASQVEPENVPRRAPLSDAHVRDFIGKVRRIDPRTSCTYALRQLRDAGFACEQRRFSTLFRSPEGAR
jgi:hypothetical protein